VIDCGRCVRRSITVVIVYRLIQRVAIVCRVVAVAPAADKTVISAGTERRVGIQACVGILENEPPCVRGIGPKGGASVGITGSVGVIRASVDHIVRACVRHSANLGLAGIATEAAACARAEGHASKSAHGPNEPVLERRLRDHWCALLTLSAEMQAPALTTNQ